MTQRSVFLTVLLAASLCACTSTRSTLDDPGAIDAMFDHYEVITGSEEGQSVLAGFFLGGGTANLAVLNIGANDERRLRIYGYGFVPQPRAGEGDEFVMRLADDFGDGVWMRILDATLGAEVLFVDVANIDGRDRLLTCQPGRLNWFDPASGTQRLLVEVSAGADSPPAGVVPHVDITRDVNGDGRDDLVVPDDDGLQVFIQMAGGAFADAARLGPPFATDRIYESYGYRHDPWALARVHELDHDHDGRRDLVFWNQDHFEVHYQDEQGLFTRPTETFTTQVQFDSDDLASLAAPMEVRRRRLDRGVSGALTGRVLHSFNDMNGDGVADMVVFSLVGGSLWRMNSILEVHYGAAAPEGGIVFAPDAGAAIHAEGIPFGMVQHDFDDDGRVEVMYTTVETELLKTAATLVSSLLTRSGAHDLKIYRMDGGTYAAKPAAGYIIRSNIPGVSGERAAYFPPVFIADVNSDGRSDLLMGTRQRGLHIYLGVEGPSLLDEQPHSVQVSMPVEEENTWLVDLNRDGRQDILMHHASDTEPDRVTMLIAH